MYVHTEQEVDYSVSVALSVLDPCVEAWQWIIDVVVTMYSILYLRGIRRAKNLFLRVSRNDYLLS